MARWAVVFLAVGSFTIGLFISTFFSEFLSSSKPRFRVSVGGLDARELHVLGTPVDDSNLKSLSSKTLFSPAPGRHTYVRKLYLHMLS